MNAIFLKRMVPVAVLDRAEDALPLADALLAGGLNIIEITFRTPAAEPGVRALSQQRPHMLVGAGTLLTPGQVHQARDAGARFGVSPGINPAVIAEANRINLPFVPGVMTPTDVETALALGCKLQKFFPADVAGGVKMLKALTGPYVHTGVRFLPLGGVNLTTAAEYLALPIVAAVGGSWIVDRKLIAEKQWPRITELTREILALSEIKS